MKKTGLFKIIMFILLGIVVATWIFSSSYYTEGSLAELGMYNVGFFDYFSLLFGSFEFSYFIQILFLLISIGALYGVLGKTGKYRAWIEKIANNLKGEGLIFLIIISFIIAILSSVFDYGFCLFIFIPFIISIILAMGYDKITAALATFGAMLIGTIGSTLGANTSATVASILELDAKAGIFFKVALFVLSYIVLIIFLSNAKRNKKSNSEEDLFIGEKISNKYSLVPIIVVLCFVFVILVLGCTTWANTFNINLFSNIHETITTFSPKMPYFHITSEGVEHGVEEVAIFGKIFGQVSAFGEWHYAEMAIICLLASLVLGLCYRVENKFASMAEGAMKMLKPALMVVMCYTVVYFAGNQMFYPTIASIILGISSKFSIILSSITMAIGSALHIDMLYVANYVVPQLTNLNVDKTLVVLLAQGIYGVTMFVTPTSALLVFGLTYLNIPYKEWIKKTWKLILALLAVVFVILLLAKFM